jgi:hypothetical protein
MDEQEKFNNYFSMLKTYNINFKTVLNHIICRSELDERNINFLCQLISNKEYFNKIESEGIEVIRYVRGEELLKNYVDCKVNDEIKALENIMKTERFFLNYNEDNFLKLKFENNAEKDMENIHANKIWT